LSAPLFQARGREIKSAIIKYNKKYVRMAFFSTEKSVKGIGSSIYRTNDGVMADEI